MYQLQLVCVLKVTVRPCYIAFEQKNQNLHYTRVITPKRVTSGKGPSPRHSAWAAHLPRNVAAVASCWRHCVRLTDPRIKLQTYRTDNKVLTTELTVRLAFE